MDVYEPDLEEGAEVSLEEEVTDPPMYKVILLNDDYTPMDFVVEILMTVFHLSEEESSRIMLNVHEKGSGLCGVYTYEVAETKVVTVHSVAEENGYPLRSIMEKE